MRKHPRDFLPEINFKIIYFKIDLEIVKVLHVTLEINIENTFEANSKTPKKYLGHPILVYISSEHYSPY